MSTILVFCLSCKLLVLVVRSSVLFVVFCLTMYKSVKVDGKRSHPVDEVSGVTQGIGCNGSSSLLLYTGDLPCLSESTFVAYADDSTLLVEVSRSLDRLSVSASLNRDLACICLWCNSWGMRVNPNKTKFLVISRSRNFATQFPSFVLYYAEVERVHQLRILGVTIDLLLTFETHIRSVVASDFSRLGLLRKTLGVFDDLAYLLGVSGATCFQCLSIAQLSGCQNGLSLAFVR